MGWKGNPTGTPSPNPGGEGAVPAGGRAELERIGQAGTVSAMPGREGGRHIPSSLAQNWLCGEEHAAPTAEWESAKRPGESALENLCCPALAQVAALFSRSSRVPSHPVQDASWIGSRACGFSLQRGVLLHVLACWVTHWSTFSLNISFYPHTHSARKDDCAHYADWGSKAVVQSVCIPTSSSVGQATSPSLLHLGPGVH